MKQFFKYVAATVFGLFLTVGIMIFFGVVTLTGLVISESASETVEDNSILKINVSGTIEERSVENPISSLMGDKFEGIALDETLQALSDASKDDRIKGLYLNCGVLLATPAMAEELREAILEFKSSKCSDGAKKWVIAYADQYTKMSYYIASAADQILLNPDGGVSFNGIAAEPVFYKDVLDKVGVKMQIFRVGTYKSAVEPFMCSEMSPANREQVTSYITSIWGNVVKDVAASRKNTSTGSDLRTCSPDQKGRTMTAEQINSTADSLVFVDAPEVSMKAGLVDKLCYLDEVKAILRGKMGLSNDDDDKLTFISATDYENSQDHSDYGDQVAVYYAYGEIVDVADPQSAMEGEHFIVGSEMVKDLQELRNNDDVKAVVIRVNSPGGSAYASEQIWREISLLKAKKPVVISMGGLAASGGYYISCVANRIFAEPMTITGSIGIFGMIPDMSDLLTQKIGLHFDTVKTNDMSDFLTSVGRPMTPVEAGKMQAYVNRGYERFTKRVADGRKMSVAKVKQIAEGRVWTGEQALKIGLVDEMGNLQKAVAYAAKAAKLTDYATVSYPAEENFLMQFLEEKHNGYLDSQLRETLGEYYTPYSLMKKVKGVSPLQARIPYDINIK